jgi:hypothetical protein
MSQQQKPRIVVVPTINPFTLDEAWIEDDFTLWRDDRDAWERKHAELDMESIP